MARLLVIDDDPLVLQALALTLAGVNLEVDTAGTGTEGIAAFTARRPDVVLCDIHLPDLSGLETLARLKATDPAVPVVLMTGHGTADTAIEAMRRGAFDYVLKPPDPDHLADLLRRAIDVGRLMRVPAVLSSDDLPGDEGGDHFVGRCPAMQEVFKAIGRVAGTGATVLIRGESGTGKELVARAVYHYSRREGKPFLAVNCAAIPEPLLESELFGHEKGSFTGADRKRAGKFEQADGGTLFLDEIGDMTLLAQSKLLRVLQERRFERVGGSETVTTDVRLIAATHRDLEAMVAAGSFREDLYYRLNVCQIHIPPLRERAEDIPLLVRYLLRRAGGEFGRAVTSVSDDAMAALTACRWPGNVRQLQSVLRRALLHAAGPVLTAADLPAEARPGTPPPADPDRGGEGEVLRFARRRLAEGTTNLYAEVVELVEREVLTVALTHTQGNITRTAQILGITRPTLRSKLAHHGLAVEIKSTVAEYGP